MQIQTSLEELLKTHFGYNGFRLHQREIISACIEGRDVLAILPTGAGKSICYQLPALFLPGITIVVSPLISLMQDQVVSLSKSGIPAAFLNSSLSPSEAHSMIHSLDEYKLLYVAPERFANNDFIQALQKTSVSLFAIDEAHCISQWGHSFRPDYRQFLFLKQTFPKTPIMALTATATRDVEADIEAQLSMENPFKIRASFDRPNLTIRIYPKKKLEEQLFEFLTKHPKQSGILYSATRKEVDEIHTLLQEKGFKAEKYHAGLSDQERSKAQHDFIHGECLIMVATVAFGMGIHKPDIRFIVHLNMPRSIEQYYQEIGRAGRDGLPSECLMLHSVKELKIYDLFLQGIPDETARKSAKAKTEKMTELCHSFSCRRKAILRYFGEIYRAPNCDGCDQCLDNTELLDATLAAKKILSCVHRLQEGYGIKHVIDVLRGAKTKSIMEKGHDRLSTFNLMAEYSEEELRHIIQALIEKGFLEQTLGDYPVLKWTETSKDLVWGNSKAMIRKKISSHTKRKKSLDLIYDEPLFDKLAQVRKKFASEAKVPAYVIFPDKTLIEMCQTYPYSQTTMLNINGVSDRKWEKYGKEFLNIITDHRKSSK